MSFASTSTTSLVSNTTVSSRAPLTGSAVPPKDFQAAFANLQSTYGFGGSTPSPVQKQKKSSAPSSTTSLTPRAPPKGTKNPETAFADLQSTYGFGGAVPSPVAKPKKQDNRSFFSKLTRSSSSSSSSSHSKPKARALPRPIQHMTAL
ncbi:hypothetical protein DFH06DRAFT_1477151 [Mycena polygramma]|nr:hypothetical protein DFH06DRAFT_1477151 [Mycena polygramma]